jgi:type I site-specific restriction endonuclease
MMTNQMQIQLRPHQERGVAAMAKYNKGQVIVPTGGGKTLKMIYDALRELQSQTPQTIVVVAPRILLAEQLSAEFLEFITNAAVFHIHSGETHHESSTHPRVIRKWVDANADNHKLIVTTYNSLQRLVDSEVDVDTIYFDESHNSVQRNFFPATEHFAANARRCYFFTATRKTSVTVGKPGMNDVDVYGNIICKVSAPELIEGGYIVPPKVYSHKSKTTDECGGCPYERDKHNLIDIINTYGMDKVLVVSKKTKDIVGLTTQTDFQLQMEEMGYDVLHISSKFGAFINNQKVNREIFFDTLNAYGKDVDKKFVVLHFDILAEGLNISCLNGVVFQRSTDYIKILQTVGRAVRLDPRDSKGIREGSLTPGAVNTYSKSFGLVVTPVFDKVGVSTATKINNCLDTVFNRGEILDSVVRK